MTRKKHATLAPLICLLSALVVPAMTTAQEEDPASPAEMVTDFLEQDIFLQPGVGLKSVKIGMGFEQVFQTWGPPTTRDKGFTEDKWIYRVADHTRITLVGNESVESMRVAGSFNSPYVTAEGASFGMAQHQIATIYGAVEGSGDNVRYENRGIGFVLENGQVSEMRVFSPKN